MMCCFVVGRVATPCWSCWLLFSSCDMMQEWQTRTRGCAGVVLPVKPGCVFAVVWDCEPSVWPMFSHLKACLRTESTFTFYSRELTPPNASLATLPICFQRSKPTLGLLIPGECKSTTHTPISQPRPMVANFQISCLFANCLHSFSTCMMIAHPSLPMSSFARGPEHLAQSRRTLRNGI